MGALGLDLARQGLQQFHAARDRRDAHAFGREAFRDGAADAHAGAGDQRRLALKLQVHPQGSALLSGQVR